MKKTKKITSIIALSIGLVSVLSGVVYANVGYSFTLPSTGSKYTNFDRKQSREGVSYNNCNYVGWSDTINCWVNNNGGDQLTSTSSFSSSGRVKMYYPGGLGSDYYGHDVQMQIKTGKTVWHEINVNGEFDAN